MRMHAKNTALVILAWASHVFAVYLIGHIAKVGEPVISFVSIHMIDVI